MIHFLCSILSVAMLEFSTEVSLTPLIEVHMLYKMSNILRPLCMFVTRLTFTKFD